jgi:hypothetical protein
LSAFEHLEKPPARTFLVHGELDQAEGLAQRLKERGFGNIDIPAPGQKAEIGG